MSNPSFTTLTVHADGRLIAIRREDVRVVEEEVSESQTPVTRIRLFDHTEFVVRGSIMEVLKALDIEAAPRPKRNSKSSSLGEPKP